MKEKRGKHMEIGGNIKEIIFQARSRSPGTGVEIVIFEGRLAKFNF